MVLFEKSQLRSFICYIAQERTSIPHLYVDVGWWLNRAEVDRSLITQREAPGSLHTFVRISDCE